MDSITKEELEKVVDRLLNSPKPEPTFIFDAQAYCQDLQTFFDRAVKGKDFNIVIIDDPVIPHQTFFDIETIKGLSLKNSALNHPNCRCITADD